MHDIKYIRDNPTGFDLAMQKRNLPGMAGEILLLDEQRRALQTDGEKLLARRNQLSQEVGKLKAQKLPADHIMAEVNHIKENIEKFQQNEQEIALKIKLILESLPNIPADEVPAGQDENDNKLIRTMGEPNILPFTAKRHFELGEQLQMMDFETAAEVSGARFVFLRADLAQMERAIASFMLDTHTRLHGYQETTCPNLVKTDTVYGTGQLPKFSEDLFKTTNDYWLIPTAEVPLTAQCMGKIYDGEKLPLRFTSLTSCYRSEAGAAGRDTRGMIRQHQFQKVELVTICRADQSEFEHEFMTNSAEKILQLLELPYRTMLLCGGDMGFGATKTYDIEVWLPGEGKYREISSCSNVREFQARRLNGRYKFANEKGTKFVHTLNGSGLAVGRCLVAILENYQNPDGSIAIPSVLQGYMGGKTKIEKLSLFQ